MDGLKQLKRLALVLLTVAVASMALAQETAPKISVQLPKSIKAGKTVKGTVVIEFSEGLHAYQNPPSKDYLIPVSITLEKSPIKLDKIKYPLGQDSAVPGEDKPVKVYEGKISIPISFTAPKKPGNLKLAFDVRYQQCNASSCFPPTDAKATASAIVKK